MRSPFTMKPGTLIPGGSSKGHRACEDGWREDGQRGEDDDDLVGTIGNPEIWDINGYIIYKYIYVTYKYIFHIYIYILWNILSLSISCQVPVGHAQDPFHIMLLHVHQGVGSGVDLWAIVVWKQRCCLGLRLGESANSNWQRSLPGWWKKVEATKDDGI